MKLRLNWQCRALCIALVPLIYILSLGPVARWCSYDSELAELYWKPAMIIDRVPVVGHFVDGYIDLWLNEGDRAQTTR